MSDLLTNLVARTLTGAPAIRPASSRYFHGTGNR